MVHTDVTIVTAMPIEQELYDTLGLLPTPRFCGESCEDGFRTDRRLGVIYPPFELTFDSGNVRRVGWYDGMRWQRQCPYCRADLETPEEKALS